MTLSGSSKGLSDRETESPSRSGSPVWSTFTSGAIWSARGKDKVLTRGLSFGDRPRDSESDLLITGAEKKGAMAWFTRSLSASMGKKGKGKDSEGSGKPPIARVSYSPSVSLGGGEKGEGNEAQKAQSEPLGGRRSGAISGGRIGGIGRGMTEVEEESEEEGEDEVTSKLKTLKSLVLPPRRILDDFEEQQVTLRRASELAKIQNPFGRAVE